MPSHRSVAIFAALVLSALVHTPAQAARERKSDWLGTEMPLPLTVRTPQDLVFKAAVERQYLTFNLMAAGKVAWDAGDYLQAAEKWETLLKLPALDREIDAAVRPLAIEARARAGKPPAALPPPPPPAEVAAAPLATSAPVQRRSRLSVVDGVVSGGGIAGPGGTVVTLHRLDGHTPLPQPMQGRVVRQYNKQFEPHVLAVTVGTSVVFRNAEEGDNKGIFHDIFSLSPAAKFDTGLYRAPDEKAQLFDKPGVVQLLCNIHAKMNGFIDVVDTPWFGQADGSGQFHIAGVPAGEYQLEAWNEFSARPTVQNVTVGREALHLALNVSGDRSIDPNPPNKYGKPRQEHLGY